jgi:alkanesulfonate monooxygenase SsuD/methylene tetrahydromethanopterin reductase-like flavin-dependent oxidoreductase (luciferase family)
MIIDVVALHVGIMLPSRETAMTGRHDVAGLVEFGKEAEAAGFDSVWVGDSLLARSRAEPLSVLAAVAAVTNRVRLGTAALIAPLRHPLLAAAQAATVDQLSGGRLILGVGSAAPLPESRREFDAVGIPFAARSARLDETVALWRQAWTGEGGFNGRFWQLDDLAGAQPAAHPAGPPVWLAGGDTPKVIERVAASYDGWLPFLPNAGAYAQAWNRIRDATDRPITAALYATININDDAGSARAELDAYMRAYYRQPLEVMNQIQAVRGGSIGECVDWLAGYVEAGARHLILRIGALDARAGKVADQLLPALRGIEPKPKGFD